MERSIAGRPERGSGPYPSRAAPSAEIQASLPAAMVATGSGRPFASLTSTTSARWPGLRRPRSGSPAASAGFADTSAQAAARSSHAAPGEDKGGLQQAGIEIIAAQHAADAGLRHRRGRGPAEVGAAAHHVRAAHDDEVAGGRGRLGHRRRHRELADPRAAAAVGVAHHQRAIVMAGHWQAGGGGGGGDALQRRLDLAGPRCDATSQGTERVQVHACTVAVFGALRQSRRTRRRIAGVWSLKANRWTWPAAMSASAVSSASRL